MIQRETCGTCKFWCRTYDFGGGVLLGACRRHAPERRATTIVDQWPHTESTDWCGDYDAREAGGLAQSDGVGGG